MTDRPHGDVRRYWDGCRCVPCRAAQAVYRQGRRRVPDATYVVSAQPTRTHLARLRRLGAGAAQIARLTAVAEPLVRAILAGRRMWIREHVAVRLLALDVRKADGSRVSAWRTRKLLASLEAEGWRRRDLAKMIGRTPDGLLCRGQSVRVRTARDVEELYARLMDDALSEPLPDHTRMS